MMRYSIHDGRESIFTVRYRYLRRAKSWRRFKQFVTFVLTRKSYDRQTLTNSAVSFLFLLAQFVKPVYA